MSSPLQLFEAFGVELEYMIVDRHSLDVCPITDQVLHAVAGEYISEVDLGRISWSNELALHVIELKTTEPDPSFRDLASAFAENIQRIDELLLPHGARLMPTAMHPWMHPDRELKLWPHEYNPVYEAYNRIFDCRGHGWANLQSVHLNLPFAGDEQFGQLHAAIRLLLPLLPALAASSPLVEGQLTGIADNRMHTYRNNSRRVPLITGDVVPEPVFTHADYEQNIFQPMYKAIAPLDTDGILQHEWLNSRGAIARFDRNAIEIRVLDIQEYPSADVAICEAIVAILKAIVEQRWSGLEEQQDVPTAMLSDVLMATVRDAEQAVIEQPDFLRHFGLQRDSATADWVWQHLIHSVSDQISDFEPLRVILESGPLARRIECAVRDLHSKQSIVYGQLCDCLSQNQPFLPGC